MKDVHSLESSIVEDLFLTPVFVLVVAKCLHAGTAFSKADGVDTDVVAGGFAVLADTFESKVVLPRIGPEIHEMEFPQVRLRAVQIERFTQLDAIENRLPDAKVVRACQFQQQP